MSKTVFTIVVPEANIRKKQAPPARAHKKKNAYTRKAKHNNHREEKAYGPAGVFGHADHFANKAPVYTTGALFFAVCRKRGTR